MISVECAHVRTLFAPAEDKRLADVVTVGSAVCSLPRTQRSQPASPNMTAGGTSNSLERETTWTWKAEAWVTVNKGTLPMDAPFVDCLSVVDRARIHSWKRLTCMLDSDLISGWAGPRG